MQRIAQWLEKIGLSEYAQRSLVGGGHFSSGFRLEPNRADQDLPSLRLVRAGLADWHD